MKKNEFFRLMALMIVVLMLGGCKAHRQTSNTYVNGYKKVIYQFPQSDDDATARLLGEAKMWLGVPYKYAGNDRGGVDCSGLMVQIYQRALGISLPRVSREQADYCRAARKEELVAGDLVFFATGKDPRRISHVGMVIEDGKMIHASTQRGVVIDDYAGGYFADRFIKSGRVEAFHSMKSGNKKKRPETQPVELSPTPPIAREESGQQTSQTKRRKGQRKPSSRNVREKGTDTVAVNTSKPTPPVKTKPARPVTPEPSTVPEPSGNPEDARAAVLSRLKLD